MKRLTFVFAALAVLMCSQVMGAQAPPGPIHPAQRTSTGASQTPAPSATPQAAPQKITAYTLPPDLYAKSKRLSRIGLAFFVIAPVYGLIVLWLLLRWKLGPRYRGWAEGKSSNLFLQVLVFAPLFILSMDVLEIPLGVGNNWVLRKFGLSVQGWGSWAWDWAKGEFVGVIIGIIFIWILYAALRKSPRRWWFYFWLASLPVIGLVIFLQPVVVDPLFHKFVPMQQKNPALTASLEQMIQRAGQDIPPERIYWMNASEKVNELNAYVTGIGASKRMVVWDTTLAKMNAPQVVAVCGHEMGHYVLNHIAKGLTIAAIGSLIIFYLGFRLIGGLLAWRGAAWGIRSTDDLASLPALLLLLGIFTFILSPLVNTGSRYFEHQADQYALEVTHGLTPDSGQVAAQAFQVLGEVDLDYPDPGPIEVFLTYDHPATRDRVQFSLTYDPWANGGTGEFVH